MDIIYEAVGITDVAFGALEALSPNGICILTGIPSENQPSALNMSKVMKAPSSTTNSSSEPSTPAPTPTSQR